MRLASCFYLFCTFAPFNPVGVILQVLVTAQQLEYPERHGCLIAGLESISDPSFGGFSVSFSPTNHVASRFVDLSMLLGDGRVRT